jgi:amino acid permease
MNEPIDGFVSSFMSIFCLGLEPCVTLQIATVLRDIIERANISRRLAHCPDLLSMDRNRGGSSTTVIMAGRRNGDGGSLPESEGQFSFVVTLAFCMNYIIGSGFLTIPYAFAQVGCTLGVAGLSLLTFFAISAASFIVETMARADYLREHVLDGQSARSLSREARAMLQLRGHSYQSIATADDVKRRESFELDNGAQDCRLLSVKHRTEMTELCKRFLGSFGLYVYALLISLYLYGTLWAFSTVFANSFYSVFGVRYWVFLLAFAGIVVPCTMLELKEQVTWQMFMAVWRVITLSVMIVTVIIAHVFHADAFRGFERNETEDFFKQVTFSKIHILLPIVTYANIFHHSIPAISQPVADKSQAGNIFTSALCVCYLAYLSIGLIIPWYFDGSEKASSNLMWASYVGSSNPSSMGKIGASIISKLVVLFPALDVASAYPLNAITLGNNLMSLVYPGIEANSSEDSDDSSRRVKYTKYAFRAVASGPPIVAAFFISDLGLVTSYTGLCGFAIAYIFPPLLCYYSDKFMKDCNFPSRTLYGGWYSSYPLQVAVLAFGAFAIIYVFICNLLFGM